MTDRTLILGASSDIGLGLVRQLCSEGQHVLGHCGRSRPRLDSINPLPGTLTVLPANLADAAATATLIETIRSDHGAPTAIVHLPAPKFRHVRFKDLEWADIEQDLHVQLRSLALVLRAFLPDMARARRGKVVVVLSSYVIGPPPKMMAHYVTAKYALLGLAKAAAAEYADKNIQINAVSPSMTETRFLSEIPEKLIEMARDQHPLQRNATPADVVRVIRFLLSEASDYMTGVNLPLTGAVT